MLVLEGPSAPVLDADGGAPTRDDWAGEVEASGGGVLLARRDLLDRLPWHVRAVAELEWKDDEGGFDGLTAELDLSHPWRVFLQGPRPAPRGLRGRALPITDTPYSGSGCATWAVFGDDGSIELHYCARPEVVPLRLGLEAYWIAAAAARGWPHWELAFAREPVAGFDRARLLADLRARLPGGDLSALERGA